MKVKVIVVVVVLLAVFLLGFLPKHREASRLKREVAASNDALSACRTELRTAELRALLAASYLEVTRKNYHSAGSYSSSFFTRASQVARQTEDAALRSTLQPMLAMRDTVVSRLAQGDPAVLADLQNMLERLLQHTGVMQPAA